MEEKRTAELLSDFDDYKIGDADGAVVGHPEAPSPDKAARKKKKVR
jgi:hypothetical protein